MFSHELDILIKECPLHLSAADHVGEARVHQMLWDGKSDSIACAPPSELLGPHTTRQHLYSAKLKSVKKAS